MQRDVPLGMVCWNWLGCWVVGRLWLVLRELGYTLVLDVSNIPGVSIGHVVSDNLGAAVGQGHPVLALDGIAVPVLVLAKVGARVVVSHGILVGVDGGSVGWGSIGGWGTCGIGGGSQEQGSDESLHFLCVDWLSCK